MYPQCSRSILSWFIPPVHLTFYLTVTASVGHSCQTSKMTYVDNIQQVSRYSIGSHLLCSISLYLLYSINWLIPPVSLMLYLISRHSSSGLGPLPPHLPSSQPPLQLLAVLSLVAELAIVQYVLLQAVLLQPADVLSCLLSHSPAIKTALGQGQRAITAEAAFTFSQQVLCVPLRSIAGVPCKTACCIPSLSESTLHFNFFHCGKAKK